MDQAARTYALRMIPYGVHVVTAVDPATMVAAAVTSHWLTQTSFSPCLIAVSLPKDHAVLGLIRQTSRFAINMLGKDDAEEALTLRRHAPMQGNLHEGNASIGGWGVSWGRHATMLLQNAVTVLECEMRAILEAGDHYPVIAEVIDAHVRLPQTSRPDTMALHIADLGETVFFGG
jgi:3-hydroxy-9,10-secoandrosta-1,3,5(10)-triene-9,17-dione monooxygenase reductase component